MLKAAKEASQTILGFYPSIEAADPEAFAAALVVYLARYPTWFIALCADPWDGIPGAFKFLPRLAEVKAWIDKRYADEIDRQKRRDLPRLPAPPVDRSNRPSLDELKAKYGPHWGLKTLNHGRRERELKSFTDDDLRALYPPRTKEQSTA